MVASNDDNLAQILMSGGKLLEQERLDAQAMAGNKPRTRCDSMDELLGKGEFIN